MTTVRRINVSQVRGEDSNSTNTDEIRPYGDIGLYEDNNGKLELLIADGSRTNVRNKVLNKGTFYGGDSDGSEGLGYDTIKLVPDEVLRRNGSDQYIIIDPTGGEPNHIHLRAGGTIDSSSTDLFLGGELNHVKVSDEYDTVTISTDNNNGGTNGWTFNSIGDLTFPTNGNIIFDSSANSTIYGITGIQFADDTIQTTAWTGTIPDVVIKSSGTWTITTGVSSYSFSVDDNGTYILWVLGNIPNGIIKWNATATISNSNVPVLGDHYAWVYNGGGTPIDFTSIPNQFTGTSNTIVRSNGTGTANSNVFTFGINNSSGSEQIVNYGWVKIS
jgi:hypothetical protein